MTTLRSYKPAADGLSFWSSWKPGKSGPPVHIYAIPSSALPVTVTGVAWIDLEDRTEAEQRQLAVRANIRRRGKALREYIHGVRPYADPVSHVSDLFKRLDELELHARFGWRDTIPEDVRGITDMLKKMTLRQPCRRMRGAARRTRKMLGEILRLKRQVAIWDAFADECDRIAALRKLGAPW